MVSALHSSEAAPDRESRFIAGFGYRQTFRDDPRPLSIALLVREVRTRVAEAPEGMESLGYQPDRGLAPYIRSEPLFRARREMFAPEQRRISGPIQFVLKLLENWRLDKNEAALLLGFDETEEGLVRAVFDGREAFHGRDVRDRIAHLFEIRKTLSGLFRDLEVENDWLREPHELLDGRKPLELLLGGSMEDLLLVREYVDAAAGR